MQNPAVEDAPQVVVVLATGGTIAGVAATGSVQGHLAYRAGALAVQELVAAVPALQAQALDCVTVAQLDSCDMDHGTWVALYAAVVQQLARPEVVGLVITHGTDTLEETAYFLHRTVVAHKPVVLTAAMRPATALSADGPQNLLDAVTVARHAGARGVVAVLAARVHAGAELRKLHGYRVDAFSSGDAGPLAVLEDGRLRVFRRWPLAALHAAAANPWPALAAWPQVEVLTSHAGASGRLLHAAVAAGARGLVIAGNGTVHADLLRAAQQVQAEGVRVLRSTRCVGGGVVDAPVSAVPTDDPPDLPSAGALTPAQARIELMLDLMLDAERDAAAPHAEAAHVAAPP